MSKRVGVVLSGCGVYDGAEIHESVLALLALDEAGAAVTIAAPDKPQAHVINHLTGAVADESRNVLVEAARIARGNITPLAELATDDLDALIFPGGFGGAKNLSTFAFDGAAMTVDPDVQRVVAELRATGKPIGFICITPAFAAKLIPGLQMTLGPEGDAPAAARSLGADCCATAVGETVVDAERKVVSTGAYMHDGVWLSDVNRGIRKLVAEVLALA
jgi:enhancing lycopene biosynthesis protein 2